MSILGLIQSSPKDSGGGASGVAGEFRLRVDDILASRQRLWFRGRLSGVPRPEVPQSGSWWVSWRHRPVTPLPEVHVETQVAGKVLSAVSSLGPSGEIEALYELPLPPSRRGWRVARNRVTVANQTAELCGLVLTPPPLATAAVVVVLPRSETLGGEGGRRLRNFPLANRLAPVLQKLTHGPHGRQPIYYVACVPFDGEGQQAELALAATSLNWPSGHFLLLPTDADSCDVALSLALDRLRWLFAGSLDLLLFNLDLAAQTLVAGLGAATDRAPVSALAVPHDSATDWLDQLRPDVPARCGASLRPARSRLVTRHPVVFCHGMLACSLLRMQLPRDYNYFTPLRKFLEERGFRVLFPLVTPTGGVAERAGQLREQITRWTDEPVNVVAHSMGGLDARYLISRLDMAGRVRSLTTVSTPHRGSPLADWFLQNYRQRVPLLLALEALGISVDGFRDCRPALCREFNAHTPDSPHVRYFSYAGDVPVNRVTPVLRRAWEILTPLEGPNDGMVSVASARWGEYLGTLYADHFAQTPDGLFVHPEEDFDSLGFFTRLVEDLARRGF